MSTLPGHQPESSSAVREITHLELVSLLGRRAVTLLDVLPEESYLAGHLPGAVNLPLSEFSKRMALVLPHKSAPIVTYCGGFT